MSNQRVGENADTIPEWRAARRPTQRWSEWLIFALTVLMAIAANLPATVAENCKKLKGSE